MLAAGEVSSRELVELSLARIEATQATLNAFRVVCAEAGSGRGRGGRRAPRRRRGRAAARRAGGDQGRRRPGRPHDAVRLRRRGFAPVAEDAELVRRLRAAGAIVLGKTNAPEVGQWPFTESPDFGATRNPWSLDHTPGGSSGGAAAAVAAGLVAAAIGSDGAGSVRIPAAWTNLVGLKPQRGRISTWPDAEAFNGLSCFGPLARSVGDAALLLDAVAGNVPGDRHQPPAPPASFAALAAEPPPRLRIALSFATPFGVPDAVDPEIRTAVEATAERLAGLGHDVVEQDPRYGLAGPDIVPRGMAGVHEWLRDRVPDHGPLEPRTRVHGRFGRALSGPPLRLARAGEPALRRRIGRIFERCDVVLTPTTAKQPARIGQLDGRGYWATSTAVSAACPFAFAWNVTGWPGLSVPAGFARRGPADRRPAARPRERRGNPARPRRRARSRGRRGRVDRPPPPPSSTFYTPEPVKSR